MRYIKTMKSKSFQPVIELTRGEITESIHYGALAVVDYSGNLVTSYGDPNRVVFLRSTAKPLQAIPLIEAGGHTHFNLTDKEIAVICSSHSGTDDHVEIIAGIQAKIGVGEEHLMCGAHPPYHAETVKQLILRGEQPTQLRHNCSGKHTGMLAYAKLIGAPLDNYLNKEHPVQRHILNTFAEMCSVAPNEIALGIDGCSAPVFAISLYHAARGWARLVDPRDLSKTRAEACRTITRAMTAHPHMVAGPDRFDTAIMQHGRDHIIAKTGAEGYQGIGIMPGTLSPNSPSLGIAIKIADGDRRGTISSAVALEFLRQLGILDPQLQNAMEGFGPVAKLKNWRKLVVGEMHPLFELEIERDLINK
jgi:L-asparaginase II